ncbi:hypothetical protein [Gluconobacter sp. Gdi]|uniref:hypothetical protein n=1 Tax=Gluconobacter sp. Gdi TaxID=2691888 RepID=UPI00175A7C0B|nr:hypothetical protein [Gluconobacter sp. Gdi]GFE97855.1 hypothetical protein DmGdi_29280 [Gluconobacter sp. Gdi]
MTDPRQDCSLDDCEALFVKGLRQFVDACAYINAALPDETGDARWIVTMHRLAASAAEAAENLENPSANEIVLWADETMKVRDGGGESGMSEFFPRLV